MPWARLLILESGGGPESDAMLYRYAGDNLGEFAWDTWSESVEDAKAQAEFEYGELLGGWQTIPEDVEDATSYAIELARRGSAA